MKSNKIEDIVRQEMCTGCGVCVSESQGSLKMELSEFGFLIPVQINEKFTGNAVKVCPFNPNPEKQVKDETLLAELFLTEAKNINTQIGKYLNTYVGFSNHYRATSSSGGIATYVFETLLRDNVVDHLYIVKEAEGKYEYQLFSDVNDIVKISKTKYTPVTLEKLFLDINDIQGKVAISGVACFIKAIRLKQYYNPELKHKIPFLVGIICGGLKSNFFTDYLAQKANIKTAYSKQDYRIKNPKSQAIDYSFGAFDKNHEFKQVRMQTIGDMWGTGMFKSNACDFCDDVTTELADISLGDAWMYPYTNDGLGNSVVVTRSALAENIIKKGIDKGDLSLHDLSLKKFLISQSGSFNHRHKGLPFRIKFFKRKKEISQKRFLDQKSTLDFKIVQYFRLKTRKKSLEVWKKTKNATEFDKQMKFSLFLLKTATRVYHHTKRILDKLKAWYKNENRYYNILEFTRQLWSITSVFCFTTSFKKARAPAFFNKIHSTSKSEN
jgi:coenzyme F420-reducing hydrogenase beta subunit